MKRIIGLAAVLLTASYAARAEAAAANDATLKLLNSLRARDCRGGSPTLKPLTANGKLAQAARFVKDGRKTPDALKRASYFADQSAMIHLGGPMDDAALKHILGKNYCTTLVDPGLVEAGIVRTDEEFVVVLAAPFAPPAPGDAANISREVLRLVNEARAQARKCGRKSFKPAPPVELNATLAQAALTHARDMASRGVMSHEGSDGSQPSDRVTRTGYAWRHVGENVAAGHLTAREVVAGWIDSPGHCENIMNPDYSQMAVAYVVNTKQTIGIYWAQVFARPR